MKNIFLLPALILACSSGACQKAAEHATLHVTTGTLKETSANLSYDGSLAFVGKTLQIPIDGGVSEVRTITVDLDKPGYYMIFRNPIYLSPGDELTIDLSVDNVKTVIGGTRGVEANNYLKQRYYSKGGSFLSAGAVFLNDDRPILEILHGLVEGRREDLRKLTGVTKEFKDLEEIRIKADFVNSLFYYPAYKRDMVPMDATREEYDAIMNEYYDSIKGEATPIIEELASDDRYLDIEVVRLVLARAMDIDAFKDIQLSGRFLTLIDVSGKARAISGNMSKEKYDELKTYGENIPYEDMREIFMAKLALNAKLDEGMPAIEVALRDVGGNALKLSGLADKPMYVDIWATWCGPCLAETPHFEALSKEYPGIRFVSVSVDGDVQKWINHVNTKTHGAITEVLAMDDMRKNWDIVGIPRFLLIGTDFTIISSDAPRPSQRDRIAPLLDSLGGK